MSKANDSQDAQSSPSPWRVAYQGEPGAYSEGAAFASLGEQVEPVPCESFELVFEALERGQVDRAVLPIENSLAGSIHRNYDLMLRHDVHIVGEHEFRVRHHLMALPGQSLEMIEEVLSHPQALSQCEHYLRDLKLRWRASQDTAGSARLVRHEQLRGVAAIASRRAAEVYELEILAAGIEDDPQNYTRFIILARTPQIPAATTAAKTSIVFSLNDQPSALFKALSVFALRDIDLTKLESRPLRGQRFQYLFYLDFAGNVDDERAQKALRHLEEIAPMMRVLGSYPRHVRSSDIP
ncbi:MAG: prephenate dehydratase [Bradymonadaceae bacterium]|nr:prephenate dehydratase [Lujinxingiaceae bacterium]